MRLLLLLLQMHQERAVAMALAPSDDCDWLTAQSNRRRARAPVNMAARCNWTSINANDIQVCRRRDSIAHALALTSSKSGAFLLTIGW